MIALSRRAGQNSGSKAAIATCVGMGRGSFQKGPNSQKYGGAEKDLSSQDSVCNEIEKPNKQITGPYPGPFPARHCPSQTWPPMPGDSVLIRGKGPGQSIAGPLGPAPLFHTSVFEGAETQVRVAA